MANRQSDFVTEYRQEITAALKTIGRLKILYDEAKAAKYPASFTDKAFEGENGDIDAVKLTAAMNAAGTILAGIDDSEMEALYAIRA